MTLATRLNETLTYWKSGPRGVTGGRAFLAGVTAPARHADVAEQVTTPEGKTVDSQRVYYTEAALSVGDYVALGDFSGSPGPDGLNNARAVLRVTSTPSSTTLFRAVV